MWYAKQTTKEKPEPEAMPRRAVFYSKLELFNLDFELGNVKISPDFGSSAFSEGKRNHQASPSGAAFLLRSRNLWEGMRLIKLAAQERGNGASR